MLVYLSTWHEWPHIYSLLEKQEFLFSHGVKGPTNHYETNTKKTLILRHILEIWGS